MSELRPVPPEPATSEAAALRRTGASPLHSGDPAQVGPYVPLALLGSGGMGRVYLARPVDGSPGLVALKVIRPEYAEDARFRHRFEREASVHARLRTPHTPRLSGTGFRDAVLWMATEYIPGLDLTEAVREDGALDTATVWRLTAELGRALADLAAAEIVHRDLKPSNVLLSVRGAHVIDFGISKAVDASAITGTGNRVGTPAYMSPEHLRTGRSDTASDVFSLAGTLVYAAAGRAPFGDGTGVDVMHRVAFEEPDPELLGEISAADAELGSLLSACLAKEPGRRPTPQDLVEAAGARAVAPTETAGWAEPLGAKVLARQRAYEVLHRLPAERKARLRAPDARPEVASPEPLRPAEKPRARTRRKAALIAAAGIAVCAVAVTAFVLTRPDAPATAHSPATGRTASLAAAPGDPTAAPTPGPSDGTSAEGTSGKSVGTATGPDHDPTRPEVSGAATGGRPDAASAPAASAGTSTDVTPTPSDTPSEPATPPWISDCTYYSGNGRTRPGDSGEHVLQVQCMLTKRGYSVGGSGVDGEFGPGTESAVRGFQSDKGLDADGIVGHETWTALRGSS
ncbi:protein kinase [Streptomyces sp. NBC_00289]|uniref:protein kinase domain-containing protein n=1 Tax=Streptomyces sp. NBC_00289 TaxID=2975703 RepID=UPI003251771A